MSTVKQFELSGAFLSRSLMALSLDISFARFFISIFICFIFFLMAKILDICYARTSQQLQKLFSVTHLKKSWSMSKSSTQLNWIVDISFLFSCLCNRNGNALNEIGINDDNICQSCFLCPMSNSEESEKQSRNWISSKWRQNGLIQHLREKFLCLCTSPRCLPWVLWSLWFCFLRIKTLWWQKCDCWRWTQHSITNREPSAHENSVTTFQKTEASQHKF